MMEKIKSQTNLWGRVVSFDTYIGESCRWWDCSMKRQSRMDSWGQTEQGEILSPSRSAGEDTPLTKSAYDSMRWVVAVNAASSRVAPQENLLLLSQQKICLGQEFFICPNRSANRIAGRSDIVNFESFYSFGNHELIGIAKAPVHRKMKGAKNEKRSKQNSLQNLSWRKIL